MGEEIETGGDGNNPAWGDVLGMIPEEYHEQITPHFQQWDQAAQSKIEQANNELKNFESFKPFVEHGITPEELEQGLRIMHEVNTNPQNVYESLQKAYNFGSAPVGNTPTGNNDDGSGNTDEGLIPNDPRYDELKKNFDLLSQVVVSDQQAKQQAAEDAKLDKELSDLRNKYGEYDEDFVLSKMQNGMDGDKAVEAYQSLVNTIRSQKPQAPTILGNNAGGGSGLPSNTIDPTKLTGKGTRDLVAQMLAASAQEDK